MLGGLALCHFSTLTLQVDFSTLMRARVLQMVGIPLILIPVASLSYRGLPADKSSEASAMSTLLRNLGGSLGIAWVANALPQRSHLHYERLTAAVTLPARISVNTMAEAAWQQASFIAYLDIYWLLGMMAFLACWLPLLFHTTVKVN